MGQLLIFYLQHLILTLPQKSQGVGLFAIPLPPPVCTTVGKTRNVLNKNPAASRKKEQLKPFFQFYLRLIFCVLNSYNCFTMKFLTNLSDYCILKYHKVG